MRNESIVMDDQSAHDQIEDIYKDFDNESPLDSDNDDPNTSPKHQNATNALAQLPDSQGVKNKLSLYNFVANKNSDKFSEAKTSR